MTGRYWALKRLTLIKRAAACFILVMAAGSSLQAEANEGADLQRVRCTCYIHSGITYSGQQTREGIVAGKKEWIGKAVALYESDEENNPGEFIGYFEFLDTGLGIDTDGDGVGDTITRGKSIDVYRYTMEDAKAWIAEHGDYVFMKVIDAEG